MCILGFADDVIISMYNYNYHKSLGVFFKMKLVSVSAKTSYNFRVIHYFHGIHIGSLFLPWF